MRRLLAPLAPLVAVAAMASACGSPSPHPISFPPATPPSASSVNALADLPQDVAGPPGTRNTWDLDSGFALGDGGDDQFARAVQLYVGVPTTAPTASSLPNELGPVVPFPFDQRWSELSYTTPVVPRAASLSAVVTSANALLGHEVVLAGSFGVAAAGGAATPTRLSQVVDLTSATGALALGWSHRGVALDGRIPAAPAVDAWRVTVHDAASGNVLVSAYSANVVGFGPVVPVDVSAAAGHRVSLDFELLGSPRGYVAVDEVSLKGGATEYVRNGGFEAASMAPWTVTGPDQPCQVVSGQRTVGGLVVERRVLARPDQRWARFLDIFHNGSGSAITTEANYLHESGAVKDAVIAKRPGGKALTVWDMGPTHLRDVAIVQGTSALPPVFLSATATSGGEPNVWTRFPLTVPAGGTKVIVQFVVLAETRAADNGLTPTLASAEADAIVGGFWSTTTYREGMTADQVAAIVNF